MPRIIFTIAALLAAPSAMAADLPVRSTPVPVVASSWTGFYIGGQVGYAHGTFKGPLGYDDPSLPGITAADIFNPVTRSMSGNSGVFGGQAGFNYQIGSLVLGVEGDGASVRIKGTGAATSKDTFTTWNITTESNWVATLRGRVGVALDRLLIYGTGGVAWGGIESSNAVTCVGCPIAPWATGTSSRTHTGWAAGAGAEYMLGSAWSIRAEYLFVDLGKDKHQFVGTAHSGAPADLVSPGVYRYSTDSFSPALRMHTVRLGLNLHF